MSSRERLIPIVTILALGTTLLTVVLLSSLRLGVHPYTPRADWVGPKAYYLALGDSLAFGYQPDFNWDHGYVQNLYANLRQHGVRSLTNYGCNTESSVTMIEGGCRFADVLHNHYDGPQLAAAVKFLHDHAGEVSPVTLDMGANDVIPDIDVNTCTVSDLWTAHLTTLDNNLRNTILPELVHALTDAQGERMGDLVTTNLFNPYAKDCPASSIYIQQLNAVIAANAARYNIPVVDTYDAFGGANMAATICTNSWICSKYRNIHPQSAGYTVMANAFVAKMAY